MRREPSWLEKAFIVVLASYALAVIGLDTLRPFVHAGSSDVWPLRWYPIATLGFQADNNGRIVSVDPDGPAAAAGLKPDQVIDLATVEPDRRAINIFVYVAHDSTYSMRVVSGPNAPTDVRVHAVDEEMDGAYVTALLVAQVAAMFFIALCVYLVWHSATWATWGFFLYGMWFNSGQYFVWYANLSSNGLVAFDALQAIAQALALTGFLAFAMHFPEEDVPRLSPARRVALLGSVWAFLLVSGGAAFLNYVYGWKTEIPYRVYYAFTFVVYFLAAAFFIYNYRRLPEQRPRMRWIMAAGLIGLPCFLLADVIEATGLVRYLPAALSAWIGDHDWILNLMYAINVLLPAAVVYTARNHEVMSVRFGITRAVVLSVVFVICVATVDVVTKLPIESLMTRRQALEPFAPFLSFALAAVLALVHNPLHHIVERVFAPRWHRARRELQELAERLQDDDTMTKREVDHALVERAARSLWLKYAALFRRHSPDLFVLDEPFQWPDPNKQQLKCDDPWVRCLTPDPVPLADPEDAPSAPELAIPVQQSRRQPVNRVVLYGHHDSNVRIDPDEIRLLRDVSRAAAIAYMRLELEAVQAAQSNPPAAREP
ncbi:MAG TPA: hypothetical protein VFC24_11420 [Casimicrobiaceae bacterium]|nr:hypothetical protein [Casimicrobiaceae bacterium]